MKKYMAALLMLLFGATAYSQDMRFDVRGTYTNAVKKANLSAAKSLADIVPHYPTNWITNYISVEVIATCNGRLMKAMGNGVLINKEQQNLLRTADMGAEVRITVQYKSKNAVTDEPVVNTMSFSATVVPDVEAEYLGGYSELKQYIKENAISKIPEADAKKFKQTEIRFTVNENGEVANAQISKTCQAEEIESLLLKTINTMPKWKPAQNTLGVKMKQEFVLSVSGGEGGGC